MTIVRVKMQSAAEAIEAPHPADRPSDRASDPSSNPASDGGARDEQAVRRPYGQGDATFQACGGEPGLRRLVEAFYAEMAARPEARTILALHPQDLAISIDKLARFLCGWTGGPKRYAEKYGSIHIPKVHRHLPIHEAERDAWLACMQHALAAQPYPEDLKRYLLGQLFVPAERIRVVVGERERDQDNENRVTP